MKNVIIAENSAIMKGYLKELIESGNEFKVVKLTANGEDVLQTLNSESIDLVITGHNISMINEIEISKMIMNTHPVPVIIFSDEISDKDRADLSEFNLVLILPKPDFEQLHNQSFKDELNRTISKHSELSVNKIQLSSFKNKVMKYKALSEDSVRLIVFGASTGGPQALQYIFSRLPGNFPVGIALVQHFEQGFEQGFADWLNSSSELKIRIADSKDFPSPGEVIIAPQGVQMKAVGRHLVLEDGPRVNNQKPAVDVLFSTAAEVFGKNVTAVLLTGMGRDGAKGCLDIFNKGGFTIVQDETSSVVYGMPKEAANLGAASVIIPYQEVAGFLISNFSAKGGMG
ncbi:MAG: response regulator [Spirochaetes bacterium]|nr:response regulator [Spirochaetota bacterium]